MNFSATQKNRLELRENKPPCLVCLHEVTHPLYFMTAERNRFVRKAPAAARRSGVPGASGSPQGGQAWSAGQKQLRSQTNSESRNASSGACRRSSRALFAIPPLGPMGANVDRASGECTLLAPLGEKTSKCLLSAGMMYPQVCMTVGLRSDHAVHIHRSLQEQLFCYFLLLHFPAWKTKEKEKRLGCVQHVPQTVHQPHERAGSNRISGLSAPGGRESTPGRCLGTEQGIPSSISIFALRPNGNRAKGFS